MRVKTTQHIADNPRTFDRLGTTVAVRTTKAETHAGHRIQDAPLHGLEAVAHVRQRPALDDTQRIFKVGTLRVGCQVEGVVTIAAGWLWEKVKRRLVGHE